MKKPETKTLMQKACDPDNYDWSEAFAYAGEPSGNGAPVIEAAVPGLSVSLEPFARTQIAEVVGASDGENDGPPWIAWGRLFDGRWFVLKAGCDYTGWDCQASGECIVANERAEIVQFGMDDEVKSRLGSELKGDL